MQPLSAGSSHQHAQTGSGLAPNLGTGPPGQAHGAAAAASAPLQLQPAGLQGGVQGHLRPAAAQKLPGRAPVLTDALLGPAEASQPAQAQPVILGASATNSGALADSSSPMEVDVTAAPTPQATLPADPAAAGREIAAAQHQLICLQHSADQLLRVLANHALPKAERQSQVKGQGCTGFEAPAGLCGRMPLHDAAMSCQVQAPCYNCHCQGLMPSPCCTVYCRHTQLWAAAAQVRSLAQSNAAGLEVVLAASSRVRKYAAAMKPQPMSMEQAWDLQVSCSTGLQLPLAGNKIDSD